MIDIDVMPDGGGAPAGSDTYDDCKDVFTVKCMACHGADPAGVDGTGATALIGGRDSLASGSPVKTFESYWPDISKSSVLNGICVSTVVAINKSIYRNCVSS